MSPIPLSLTPEQAVVLLGLLASNRVASEPSSEQRALQAIEQQLERRLLEPLDSESAAESAEFVAALLGRVNVA